MGCLNVTTQRVGGLSVTTQRTGCLNVTTQRTGGTDVKLTREGGLDVSTERVGGLRVNIYFICSVGKGKYLRVTPEEPLWITVGQDLTYIIRSNSDWVIL